jgi:hypothetical protein
VRIESLRVLRSVSFLAAISWPLETPSPSDASYSTAAELKEAAGDFEGRELAVDAENIGKLSDDSWRWKPGFADSACDSRDSNLFGKYL